MHWRRRDVHGSPNAPDAQSKHHQWQLDRSQIAEYGLEESKIWWEATRLTFVSMFDWLTMTVLICEDLARCATRWSGEAWEAGDALVPGAWPGDSLKRHARAITLILSAAQSGRLVVTFW